MYLVLFLSILPKVKLTKCFFFFLNNFIEDSNCNTCMAAILYLLLLLLLLVFILFSLQIFVKLSIQAPSEMKFFSQGSGMFVTVGLQDLYI